MNVIMICAWCQQEDQGKIHAQKPESTLEQISHGICQYHARRLRNSYRRSHTASRFHPLAASRHS